ADEVADGYAVRRFATAGAWAAVADGASSHGAAPSEAAAAFDVEMTAPPADAHAGAADPDDAAASAAEGDDTRDPHDIASPAVAERRC
ncbi:hypothetical protein G3N64_34915, partial [Burkholderia sp. Ac-20344]|nr:hypothetical protein [Burkholderia sp. Ac-20344]